jgi:N-acetylglucosaminyldiphosphoundecaprenol N-acetyl-beta-D-mannosaminyltransferase
MRATLLGLPICLLDTKDTLATIERLIDEGGVHQHVVLNAAKVVQAQDDDELRAAIEGCELINADGMSVVWAGRLLGVSVPERVAGIDLMDGLLALAASREWPVYFLGARQEVLESTVQVETTRHPGLVVCGYRHGYWAPDEECEVVRQIAATSPRLLFVAMPSPKKEQFLARHRAVLQVAFVMGVGGSFDAVAGVTSRAPLWMQKSGLEWLHRLRMEPRRMLRRYAVGNTRFILLVAQYWLKQRQSRRSDTITD